MTVSYTHLVLHGCTGMDEELVKRSIDSGVAKINFGTQVRCQYVNYLKAVSYTHLDVYKRQLQGNELGARGVNDSSCFGIRKCNKHGLVLFSWHCMFMFRALRLFGVGGTAFPVCQIEGKVHLDRKLVAFLNPVNEDFCCHLSHLFHGYVDCGEHGGQILGCVYVVDADDGEVEMCIRDRSCQWHGRVAMYGRDKR